MSAAASPSRWLTLPTLLTVLGVALFGLFLVGYFLPSVRPDLTDLAANLSFVGLNYFLFPLVGGITLRFAEVRPAEQLALPPAEIGARRASEATAIQKQILEDITRRAYFKSAHMADALKRIGLSRRDDELPTLAGYREEIVDGHYALVLRFDSPKVNRQRWQTCQPKLSTFFGKGLLVRLDFSPADPEADSGQLQVELYLISAAQAA